MQNEKGRKTLRAIFILVGIAAGVVLLWDLVMLILSYVLVHSANETVSDIGIIGGADGPTAILVTTTALSYGKPIFVAVAAAISIIGLYVTRKK